MPGPATSEAEVTNISKHGFWLLIDEHEFFVRSLSSRGSSRPPSKRSFGSSGRFPITSLARAGRRPLARLDRAARPLPAQINGVADREVIILGDRFHHNADVAPTIGLATTG